MAMIDLLFQRNPPVFQGRYGMAREIQDAYTMYGVVLGDWPTFS